MTGMIFDIQECTFHDGPGGRMTIFMKGCPLRCAWCHNPEGQRFEQEIMFKKNKCMECHRCDETQKQDPSVCMSGALIKVGKEVSVQELVEQVFKLKETLEIMEGGVTFSGGEPVSQRMFLLACLTELQAHGIHTCIETSGYCSSSTFQRIIEKCDVVIMDLKLMDDTKHQEYTGVSNKQILENAKLLMETHPHIIFRTPLIEGVTDGVENLKAIEHFVGEHKWEKIPSNPFASLKYEQLNREYPLATKMR